MKKIVLVSTILSLLIIFVFYQKGKQDDINREKSWTGTSKNIPKYEASQTLYFLKNTAQTLLRSILEKILNIKCSIFLD
ncbi:hypothetical protein EFE32_05680 [Lactococcus lactis subsp. lactis]|uniref:hypothetical protein n=1 Tax=Lactococcus lactis TaxID=1358 RepID=UPI00223C02F0|nr:hypothetical protein [Lactococcus lactis]MCT0016352.1 hypothetical protein [Lactococcus lactis subsp. lactis]